MILIYILLSVIGVSFVSFIGVVFMAMKRRWLHTVIMYALSFSSGVMLSATFFDLFPEGVELFPDGVFLWTLIGFLLFFAIEKLISWHHHIEGRHIHEEKPLAYLTLVGDGLHNFVDGAVIAGSYLISVPLGITSTIAIVAHEIPHELSDFMILIHGGFSNAKALLFNFLSALTAIFGAIIVIIASEKFTTIEQYLIPIATGNFLYISASDIIPELLTKRKGFESIMQIILIILGLFVVPLIGRLFGHV